VEYLYTVWLRDSSLPSDAEDHEFPACIAIRAPAAERALEWGDHLARSLCARRSEMTFLRSTVEPFEPEAYDASMVPRIGYGHEASDAEIGW
jgi:hypothetical protein